DHGSRAITSDGIGPGGHISAIVYEQELGPDGWPRTSGVSWDPFFTEAYYQRRLPVWEAYAPGWFGEAGSDGRLLLRIILMAFFLGLFLALLMDSARRA
ncbi:MAG: copper oxidase, partial [Xanthomonadales bacterium]|nr:copper oxidase [Xanthomonadales bacterium]